MSRSLSWGRSDQPPSHPYRDTLLIYGVLAIVIVIVAWLTGGALGQAALIAAAFFVVASSWSAVGWRRRLRAAAEARRAQEAKR
jgi:uncharacterized membrane protein